MHDFFQPGVSAFAVYRTRLRTGPVLAAFALFIGATGCTREPGGAVTPAVPDGGPGAQAAAADDQLDALWREAVQFRSAHEAFAANAESFARDADKAERMLEAVEATTRLPVVADPVADRVEVEKTLTSALSALKLRGRIELSTAPLEPLPPESLSATEGLRYTDGQVIGHHVLRLHLDDGLLGGPTWMSQLDRTGRLVRFERVELPRGGAAVLYGRVPFFRALTPVRFERATTDLLARAEALVGRDPTRPRPAERLASVREALTTIDGLAPRLDLAFKQQARAKIATARFRVYAQVVEAYNQQSWRQLVTEAPRPGP